MLAAALCALMGCDRLGSAPDLDAVRAREDALSLRESFLARREGGVVQRETTVGMREQALALREERVARRESMAGMTEKERKAMQRAAQTARDDVMGDLAAQGLDLRDADPGLVEHVETGDMLAGSRDFLAAEVAYRAAQAFAAGTHVDAPRVKRALERVEAALKAQKDGGVDPGAMQQLFQARGLLVDGRLVDAMKLLKRLEGPPPPHDAVP